MSQRRPYRTLNTQGPRVDGDALLCRECGLRKAVSEFRVLRSGSHESYCRDCHNAINRAWRAGSTLARKARYQAANPRRVLPPKACVVCGEVFIPGATHAKFCSAGCKRSHEWRNETPRRASAYVTARRRRSEVVAKYGLVCHICGLGIHRPASTGGDPDSLTIDHVVPITKGGTDELDNLRPAHRGCNTKKGNRTEVAA